MDETPAFLRRKAVELLLLAAEVGFEFRRVALIAVEIAEHAETLERDAATPPAMIARRPH